MKAFALLLALAVGFSAHAADGNNDILEGIDELAMEQEAAEMELFDQDRHQKRAIEERQALESEASDLNSEIGKLQKKQSRNSKKLKTLEKRYDKALVFAKKKGKEAAIERKKNAHLQAKVDRLQAKVDKMEQQAISSRNEARSLRSEIKRAEKKNRALKKRKTKANRLVKKYYRQIQKLKKRRAYLKNSNSTLQAQVSNLEDEAEEMEDRLYRLQ